MLALKLHLLDLGKQIFWGWEEYPNWFGIIYYSIDYLSTFKEFETNDKSCRQSMSDAGYSMRGAGAR